MYWQAGLNSAESSQQEEADEPDDAMHGRLVMENWAREARLEGAAGSRQQESAGQRPNLLRWVYSLLRQVGHGLSRVGYWLERHGELREPIQAERVG